MTVFLHPNQSLLGFYGPFVAAGHAFYSPKTQADANKMGTFPEARLVYSKKQVVTTKQRLMAGDEARNEHTAERERGKSRSRSRSPSNTDAAGRSATSGPSKRDVAIAQSVALSFGPPPRWSEETKSLLNSGFALCGVNFRSACRLFSFIQTAVLCHFLRIEPHELTDSTLRLLRREQSRLTIFHCSAVH